MHLGYHLKDPTEQLVQLSLLAFLSCTFKVPGRKIPYTWLATKLRDAYVAISNGSDMIDSTLRVWSLSVAAISLADTEEVWLQKAWKSNCKTTTWVETKRSLMDVMWIECIHDEPGERVHHRLASDTIA
jgi:hypothetical protein